MGVLHIKDVIHEMICRTDVTVAICRPINPAACAVHALRFFNPTFLSICNISTVPAREILSVMSVICYPF